MQLAIRVRSEILSEMLQHARREPNRECCGILAGRDGVIEKILPATNAAPKAETQYEIAMQELFRLMREIRAAGLELLGIYHSHPRGENQPSPHDIELASYPDAAYFIISPIEDAPHPARAFSIHDGIVGELEIQNI